MIRSRFFHAFILGLGALIILVSVLTGVMQHILNVPVSISGPVYLYIQKGQTLGAVAREAKDLGLVNSSLHFKAAIRVRGLEKKLYAGEYEIQPGERLSELLRRIENRSVYLRRLVIPEGLSVVEVMPLLEHAYGLEQNGLKAPAEGSLLPDTYFYERGDRAVAVMNRMKSAMNEALLGAWETRDGDLPFASVEEALVMASIVEKETAIASERPLVAAVFINRLRRGMRLQSDPTVIYGISGGVPLDRPLSRADLRAETPYNTYRVGGLPPTPIANPGREAIQAVMNPAAVPYLYFVADGSGGHAFASTLEEHNRNVARWRQIERGSR